MLRKLTNLPEGELLRNERILLTTFPSWYAELKPILVGVISFFISTIPFIYVLTVREGPIILQLFGYLLITFSFLLAPILFIRSIIKHYSVRYFITNLRVIKRGGIFFRNTFHIPYSEIQSMNILREGIPDWIVDVGSMIIYVNGGLGDYMTIDNIGNPEGIHKLISENMRKKEKSGNAL